MFVYHKARFEPVAILDALQKYPVSTFCSAPTAYRMMIQEDLRKYKFPKLRHCLSAGEPLNPEVIDEWREGTGLEIREGYGQTETVSHSVFVFSVQFSTRGNASAEDASEVRRTSLAPSALAFPRVFSILNVMFSELYRMKKKLDYRKQILINMYTAYGHLFAVTCSDSDRSSKS